MKDPCSIMTRRAAKPRPLLLHAKKRSGCRYASIWACQGLGDRARRTEPRH